MCVCGHASIYCYDAPDDGFGLEISIGADTANDDQNQRENVTETWIVIVYGIALISNGIEILSGGVSDDVSAMASGTGLCENI